MLRRLRNLITPANVSTRGKAGASPLLRNDPPAVEQRAINLAGKDIAYTLKRSGKRRSIGLRIDDRGLTVSIPKRASERWLHSVLQDKAHWVVEKLDGWQQRKPPETRWADGANIAFLGEQITLRIRQGLFATPAQQRGNELWLFVVDDNDTTHIGRAVSHWYRHAAEQLFARRGAHYAALLGVAPRAIKLSTARTQWGCCTARGTVRLNLQLIKLPLPLIDYVVAHELAHLREMNHSAAFWQIVESVCPEHVKLRRELKAVALQHLL
ncbi:MAG: M48 family metallopeptidase [Gallionellaceae bacterium]|nr:M48 family metallopeptidase [Gallionellaceae bacterium]